jgi:hypothetical protein
MRKSKKRYLIDLGEENIKTEVRKSLLDAFQLVGVK